MPIRSLVAALIAAAPVAPTAAQATQKDPCPSAPLLYYFTLHGCYLANVWMSDFTASLSKSSGTLADIWITPFAQGPAPGKTGIAKVGFDYIRIGTWGLDGPGYLDFETSYRLGGTIIPDPDLLVLASAKPTGGATFSDIYWFFLAEADAGYVATCLNQAHGDREGEFDHEDLGPEYDLSLDDLTGQEGDVCRMRGPIRDELIYSIVGDEPIELTVDLFRTRYFVMVTPEPSSLVLLGSGLGLLAFSIHRRRRR